MEENFIGYALGSLDPETTRSVEAFVAEHPEAKRQIELLRRAFAPLADDRDAIDPPADLALRTIGFVAEHIVATEGSIASESNSPVADFIRTLHQPTEKLPAGPTPVYPVQASEASPPSWSPRNLFVTGGLTVAVLMIGVAAVMTIRQTRDVQACQNNLRAMHQSITSYCDANGNQCPQVQPGADVRDVLARLNDGHLQQSVSFVCPGSGHVHVTKRVDGKTFIPAAADIEYAYCMGYRDEFGHLNGLIRGSENDNYPIMADAPERYGDQAVAVNHRKGQNVLFLGGNVRFCTNVNVGPMIDGVPDDIYYNTIHQPRAGTHRWDSVLGRANEQP